VSIEVYIERGRKIVLASEIGRGGEGTIFASPLNKEECAKIYSKLLSREDERKLELMVQNPPRDPAYDTRKHHSIAWPNALLFKDVGCSQRIGFLMPAVDTKIFRKAMSYMDPSDRTRLFGGGFNWKYLHTAAFNIVSSVAAIHQKGYCIGDINESNVLVARNALVTLIDCDSFQVPDRSSGTNYRCLVGKAEYTAPELQRKSYSAVDRTPESDCFALAVLVFQLLMEGTHPYQAKGKLVEDATSTQAKIVKGYFPYAMQDRNIGAPDHAPPFTILDPEVQRLFHRSFVEGHQDPSARPTATEWFDTLKKLGSRFRQCAVNQNHLFLAHLNSCPWCERAKTTGKDTFPSPIGQQIGLDDPSSIPDSLDKRLDYFNTYVAMALADGVLTTEEESQLHALGTKLQIPPKDIEKAIQVEVRRVNARTWSSGGGTPKLEISKSVFGFQNLRAGSTAQDSFVISNTGGGILQGSVRSNRPWLKPSQNLIDSTRHRQDIGFRVDTAGLLLGSKDGGAIEIRSNGGTHTITVDLSIEIPEAALSRFRQALTWFGFLAGGVAGFASYAVLLSSGTNLATKTVTGLVTMLTVIVAGGMRSGFAGGCGGLVGGAIFLGILTYVWPPAFGGASWALTQGMLMNLLAKPLFAFEQRQTQRVAVPAPIGCLLLVAGLIVGLNVVTSTVDNASALKEQQEMNQRRDRLLAAINSGRTLTGQTREQAANYMGNCMFHDGTSNLMFANLNKATGEVVGKIEWPKENAVSKIEGRVSNDSLTFTETESLRGNIQIGTSYELKVKDDGTLAGTWSYDSNKTQYRGCLGSVSGATAFRLP
jgi:serine/threonine protein kinase